MNRKVIRVTTPSTNGDAGVPKIWPFSFLRKESAGMQATTMTAM